MIAIRHFLALLLLLTAAAAIPAAQAGEIQVRGGTAFTENINNGDTTPNTPDDTDFGTLAVGASRDHTFRIYNPSNSSPLFIVVVTEDGAAFSIALGGSVGNINPGSFRDVVVRFDPASAGTKTAQVLILSDDSDKPNYTFNVQGEATGDPEITVRGKLLTSASGPNSISDGDVTATSSSSPFSVSGVPSVVGVGQTQSFTLAFAPTSFGSKNGTITIQNNNANEDPFTITVTGTGRGPDIDVLGGAAKDVLIPSGDTTQRPLDNTNFGTVPVGPAVARVFRIHNNGNTTMTLFGAGIDSPAFSISGLPAFGAPSIPAGADEDFTITLDPVSAGIKTGTVVIATDAPNAPNYTFTVTAEATGEPEIVVEGKLVTTVWAFARIGAGDTSTSSGNGTAFGNVTAGSAAGSTIEIENSGTDQLIINSITSDSPQFTVSNAPSTIGVGQTKSFTVAFTPTDFGPQAGTIRIRNNDANENPFTFAVSGTGIAPDIKLQGGPALNVEIADGDLTPSTADGTDFGTVNASSGSYTVPFRIRNIGNAPFSILSIGDDGAAFSICGVPNPAIPVTAGSLTDLNITFNPTSAGDMEALIAIASSDPNEPIFTFKVRGTALGMPEIAVSGQIAPLSPFVNITDGDTTPIAPDGTVFGAVAVDDGSVTHTFQIENTGNSQLEIGSITENSPHFSVASVPAVVGVGQVQTFTVTFNPTLHGTHTAVITIQNNNADEDPFTFEITGTAPDITLRGGSGLATTIQTGAIATKAADGTDFGLVDVSTGSKTTTFAIRNDGNSALGVVASTSSNAQFTPSGVPTIINPIAPGSQAKFNVTFNPSSTGQKTSAITIQSTDPDENPATFTVTGYGSNNQPAIQVTGEDSSVFTNGQTTLSTAAGTDFDSTLVTGGSVARTFQINTGTGLLTVTSILEGSTHFSLTSLPSGPINPGDSSSFTVTYDPTAASTHNATITIGSDATNAASFSLSIRGTGNNTATPEPEIALRGDDTFGSVIHPAWQMAPTMVRSKSAAVWCTPSSFSTQAPRP